MSHKILIETYGCSHNHAESLYLKDVIQHATFVENIADADIIILNTCAVKNKTVLNLRKRLQIIKKTNSRAKIILTGCYPEASRITDYQEMPELKEYALLGINCYRNINDFLNDTSLHLFNKKQGNYPIPLTGNVVCTIPIATGCLNKCTYCQTILARGKLCSRPVKEIVSAIEKNYEKGSKIFYLTSQDNGCYGYDIQTNLIELLSNILRLKGNYKIRIGMGNPQYIKKYIDDLLEIMEDERMFKFLHIPLQSGSNKILKDMKRGHTVEDVKTIVKKTRRKIPDITISTDIIVGYPTETEEDFQKTLTVLEELKPDVINRSKFSSRPGTEAFTLKSLDSNIVSQRSKQLDEKVKELSFQKNNTLIGKTFKVIIEAIKRKGSCVARNDAYKPIIVKGEYSVGDKLSIKITRTKVFHSVGEVVDIQ